MSSVKKSVLSTSYRHTNSECYRVENQYLPHSANKDKLFSKKFFDSNVLFYCNYLCVIEEWLRSLQNTAAVSTWIQDPWVRSRPGQPSLLSDRVQ